VLAVVHDDEVVAGPLPREPHDVAVAGALTPSGLVLFGP
jgi:5-formyltetrahydrofolate cyclo-ligase